MPNKSKKIKRKIRLARTFLEDVQKMRVENIFEFLENFRKDEITLDSSLNPIKLNENIYSFFESLHNDLMLRYEGSERSQNIINEKLGSIVDDMEKRLNTRVRPLFDLQNGLVYTLSELQRYFLNVALCLIALHLHFSLEDLQVCRLEKDELRASLTPARIIPRRGEKPLYNGNFTRSSNEGEDFESFGLVMEDIIFKISSMLYTNTDGRSHRMDDKVSGTIGIHNIDINFGDYTDRFKVWYDVPMGEYLIRNGNKAPLEMIRYRPGDQPARIASLKRELRELDPTNLQRKEDIEYELMEIARIPIYRRLYQNISDNMRKYYFDFYVPQEWHLNFVKDITLEVLIHNLLPTLVKKEDIKHAINYIMFFYKDTIEDKIENFDYISSFSEKKKKLLELRRKSKLLKQALQKGFEVDWIVIEISNKPQIMIRFRQTRTPRQDEEFDFETYDRLVDPETDEQLKDDVLSEEDNNELASDDDSDSSFESDDIESEDESSEDEDGDSRMTLQTRVKIGMSLARKAHSEESDQFTEQDEDENEGTDVNDRLAALIGMMIL